MIQDIAMVVCIIWLAYWIYVMITKDDIDKWS